MKKATLLVSMGTLLAISGCTNHSEQVAQKSTPGVVQAAPPVVPTAPAASRQLPADSASQSGLLTPHPSAGQRVDEGYLLSSDQNFAVGLQLVTGTGEFFMMKLAIANQTTAPVVFNVSDVSMNAVGREVTVFPRTRVSVMNIPNAGDFMKIIHSNYWDDSTVLAPNSQEEHLLLAACGKGCPMPVTVHVAVGGQTYDFVFGDASNAQSSGTASAAPTATTPASAWLKQPVGPSSGQILDSLNIDDVTDRCGQADSTNIGVVSFQTYSNTFNTGPVEGKRFRSVHIEYDSDGRIKDADALPYGSNHSVNIGKWQLPEVMPCLLHGGVAK